MNTDGSIGGRGCAKVYRQPVVAKVEEYLGCLAEVEDPRARQWTPLAAGTAAVLMAMDVGCSLATRCEDVFACMQDDFCGRIGGTYNGLVKALERQAELVLPALKTRLRAQALAAMNSIPAVAGWTLLAVDGSKSDLPRTIDHEEHFGIADNGIFPQSFTTVIVEVQTGLPWDWRIGPARSDERSHLQEMAPELPGDALLLADGGFLGYPTWSALHGQGKSFLIRVGGNAYLLSDLFPDAHIERRGDIVYTWPKQQQNCVPPLRLRLIRVGSKKKPVYLLTNVLESTRLAKKAAGAIYRRRWGVELFYRTLKRTLGYAKLLSRSARRGRIELEWGLITATILALIGIRAMRSRALDPHRLSPAGLLHVLRSALLRGVSTVCSDGLEVLNRKLARATKDAYKRKGPKQARSNRVTTNTPAHSIQPPNIRRATAKERRLAQACHPPSKP